MKNILLLFRAIPIYPPKMNNDKILSAQALPAAEFSCAFLFGKRHLERRKDEL